jgi:hypothetical protein
MPVDNEDDVDKGKFKGGLKNFLNKMKTQSLNIQNDRKEQNKFRISALNLDENKIEGLKKYNQNLNLEEINKKKSDRLSTMFTSFNLEDHKPFEMIEESLSREESTSDKNFITLEKVNLTDIEKVNFDENSKYLLI